MGQQRPTETTQGERQGQGKEVVEDVDRLRRQMLQAPKQTYFDRPMSPRNPWQNQQPDWPCWAYGVVAVLALVIMLLALYGLIVLVLKILGI